MFGGPQLLEVAKKRYGEEILRDRMRGSTNDADLQNRELLRIALGVVGRVQAAVTPSVGWPIPNTWPPDSLDEEEEDISGLAFADRWPYDLLQRALELFNWRTQSGLQSVDEQARRVGLAAERYFDELQKGVIGLSIGGEQDLLGPEVLVARSHTGASNIGTIRDSENTLDAFNSFGWDYVRP